MATLFLVRHGKAAAGFDAHLDPSLDDLDDNGDLKMTVDFRRVYATMIKEWMGYDDTKTILKGDFPTLGVIA